MLRAIQKIVKQGNSAMVTIPRQLLFAMGLLPGEFVELAQLEDNSVRIRPWRTDENITRQSPGVIPTPPSEVSR